MRATDDEHSSSVPRLRGGNSCRRSRPLNFGRCRGPLRLTRCHVQQHLAELPLGQDRNPVGHRAAHLCTRRVRVVADDDTRLTADRIHDVQAGGGQPCGERKTGNIRTAADDQFHALDQSRPRIQPTRIPPRRLHARNPIGVHRPPIGATDDRQRKSERLGQRGAVREDLRQHEGVVVSVVSPVLTNLPVRSQSGQLVIGDVDLEAARQGEGAEPLPCRHRHPRPPYLGVEEAVIE